MKHLILLLVFVLVPLGLALNANGSATDDTPTAATSTFDASVPLTGDPNVDWMEQLSLVVAHKSEPRNPIPKAMPEELAKKMLSKTSDPTELTRLTYYAFVEGSYSLDPHLPGDCRGHRPGTPKCTRKLVEAGTDCCTVQDAQHWCTLQVEPMPKDMDDCIQKALNYMRKSLADYTGSVVLADKREKIVSKLLVLVPPPSTLGSALVPVSPP